MSDVRVRFAPSPTGDLHVGGLRTALFNYLFAKKNAGSFILRIEDTDQERSVAGAEEGIVDLLQWAGVAPDEGPHLGGDYGPYRQSERLPLYREAAERLIAQGNAYRCYCTPEELEEMRRAQQARGESPKYDGRHRSLTEAQRAEFEAEGRKAVVRMRIPDVEERIVVRDVVRGDVEFGSGQLDDQVLLKSDGFPTYHLAVVVDDTAMKITHILRAEEWLPSVPKHLLLYRWLGYEPPVFVHLPLLLNEDRSKMSKRKGDVSVESFRKQGYLPGALINFLALLGWSPGDDRELMSREELLRDFSLERIGKAGAIFDRNKLNWMNQHYIGGLSPEALFEALRPFIAASPFDGEDEEFLRGVSVAIQPALTTLSEFEDRAAVFFRPAEEPLSPQVAEVLRPDQARKVVEAFRDEILNSDKLTAEVTRRATKIVQEKTKAKGRDLFGPLRAAVTQEIQGPDFLLFVETMGKQKTLNKIEHSLGAQTKPAFKVMVRGEE